MRINQTTRSFCRLEPAEINSKCSVAEYELSFSANGMEPYQRQLVTPGENGDLVLAFPGATGVNTIVQGKLKYEGTNVWSEIASSREPGDISPIHQVYCNVNFMSNERVTAKRS